MKNTFGKILVGALIFGAVAIPASAHSNHGGNRNQPGRDWHDRPVEACPYGFDCNRMPPNARQPMPQRPMGRPSMPAQPQIMGTVKSFDEKSGILEIEDADKKVKRIHINPNTMVSAFQRPPAPANPPAPPAPGMAARPRPMHTPIEPAAFKDFLKIGIWVTIRNFQTETETLEAHRIMVQE